MKKKLNIWLIKEGEALPVDDKPRLMRTGALAKYLSEQGHTVTWWSSGFIHGKKEYYTKEYKELVINDNETLILLHSPIVYKKNVSLKRFVYHRMLANQMKEKIKDKEVPDIIICSYPTVQFAQVAVKYGRNHNIPVVLDTRDFWPDIFERAFPERLRFFARIALKPFKLQTGRVYKKATALTGVVPECIDWGMNYAKRSKSDLDRCIYIGYIKEEIDRDIFENNIKYWESKDIFANTWNMCFFGTLSGNSMDLSTVIKAVKELSKEYKNIRLVVCGEGDAKEHLMKEAAGCENIVFPGWMNKEQMQSLMKISKCGLYCYKNTMDFKNAYGNKVVQYMSEGLPILSSLQGFAKEYIERYSIGATYTEGNIDSCTDEIKYLYENEKIRQQMGFHSLTCFEKEFEADIVNRQFEEYMYDLI